MEVTEDGHDPVGKILRDVNNLTELSTTHINALKALALAPGITIGDFQDYIDNYSSWFSSVGDHVRGVELDSRNQQVIIKEHSGSKHKTAVGVIVKYMIELGKWMSKLTSQVYEVHKPLRVHFDNPHDNSFKECNACLLDPELDYPTVVLEVGLTETVDSLHDSAKRWLEGTKGTTKLVIVISIIKTGAVEVPRVKDRWGLWNTDFPQQLHSEKKICQQDIVEWCRDKNVRLAGSHQVSVWLWYSDDCGPRCVLKSFPVSRREHVSDVSDFGDVGDVGDVALRMDHVMPEAWDVVEDEDVDDPPLFPLQQLVDKLQMENDEAELRAADFWRKYVGKTN